MYTDSWCYDDRTDLHTFLKAHLETYFKKIPCAFWKMVIMYENAPTESEEGNEYMKTVSLKQTFIS